MGEVPPAALAWPSLLRSRPLVIDQPPRAARFLPIRRAGRGSAAGFASIFPRLPADGPDHV